jgi:hypothetical protein
LSLSLHVPALSLLLACVACFEPAAELSYGLKRVDLEIEEDRLGRFYSDTGSGAYHVGQLSLDGASYRVEIEAAGAVSLRRFKRNMNLKILGDRHEGYQHLRLAATTGDKSMLRVPLAYEVYERLGLPTVRWEPVSLVVNGRYLGLYYLHERLKDDFFDERELPMQALYKAKGGATFGPKMLRRMSDYLEAELGPKSLAELESLADLVVDATDRHFNDEIFERVDREVFVRYLAASIVSNNWDGFDKNVHYHSPGLGEPLKLVPWDMDGSWLSARTGRRIWFANKLFERVYLATDVRAEVLDLVTQALAGDESVAVFNERLESLQSKIARAYAADPYLGGGRGLVLQDEANELKSIYAEWVQKIETSIADGDGFLGP